MLFFIDAFGWRFFERFQDTPFLARIGKQGHIEKLTSQFPSTTAAHVTTIHTGLPVGESGIHEWYYYEPLVDRIVAPLLFSFSGTKARDTLNATGLDPARLYPQGIFYPELKKVGVESFNFGMRDYTPSTYSKIMMRGSKLRPFKTLPEALVNIRLLLEKQTTPTYIHLYFDRIDALGHEYGPSAPQTEAEIEAFLRLMNDNLDRTFRTTRRILFMMTADHGMCEVDPHTTVYLNTNPDFHGFERFIKRNQDGVLLIPAGSARDMFLYINEEMLDEARFFLAERLNGKADVVKTNDLIQDGYFGPTVSPRFLDRVGNLVILPYRHESVWWYEKDKFEQRYYGHHGGLTPQEMEIALYSLAFG